MKVLRHLLHQTKLIILYETKKSVNISSYPTLENCLFGAVKLTKHNDVDQYKCLGYGIGFDRKGFFFHILLEELAKI